MNRRRSDANTHQGREVPQEDIDAHQQTRLEAFIAGQQAAQSGPASPPAEASQPQEEEDTPAGSTLEEPASYDKTIVVGELAAQPPREPRSGTPCQNQTRQPPAAPVRPKMFKMSHPGPEPVKWLPAAPVLSKDSNSTASAINKAPTKMPLGHSSKPTDGQPPASMPHPLAFFRTAPYMEPPSAAPSAKSAPEQEPNESRGSKRKSKSTGLEGEEDSPGQKKRCKVPKKNKGPKKPRGPKWEGLTTELRFLAGMYGPGGIIGPYGSAAPGPVPGAPPGLPPWLPGGGPDPSGCGGSSSQPSQPLNGVPNPGRPTVPRGLPPDQV